MQAVTAFDAIPEVLNHFITFFEGCCIDTTQGQTVIFPNNDVLCDVDQTTGQVTRVGCFQGRIGQTFTGAVCGDKELLYGQPFQEVGQDRVFDDRAAGVTRLTRFSHQTTKTAQLFDLLFGTTRTGVEHHKHRVEALFVRADLFHQLVGDAVIRKRPLVDDLVVTFVVGDQTHVVVVPHLVHFHLCSFQGNTFQVRDDQVTQVERKTCFERPAES